MDNSRTVPAPPPDGITLFPEAWELAEADANPYEWTIPPPPRTPIVPRTGISRRAGIVLASFGAIVLGAVVAMAVDRIAGPDESPKVAIVASPEAPTFELGLIEVRANSTSIESVVAAPSSVSRQVPRAAGGHVVDATMAEAVDVSEASSAVPDFEVEIPAGGSTVGVLPSISRLDVEDSIFGARQSVSDSRVRTRQGHRGSRATRRRGRAGQQRSVATAGPTESGTSAVRPSRRRYLASEDIAPVVARSQRRLQQCYGTALRRSGVARAVALRLNIAIAPSGQVSSARVDGGGMPQLSRCLEGVARRWTFPESRRGAEVPVPLRFAPGD